MLNPPHFDCLDSVWIACENNWEQTNDVAINLCICEKDKSLMIIFVDILNHNPDKLGNRFHNALLWLIRDTPFSSRIRRWIGGYLKSKKMYNYTTTCKTYKVGDVDIFRVANVHDLDGVKQVRLLVQVHCADQQGDEEVIKHKIFLKAENVKMLENYMVIQ